MTEIEYVIANFAERLAAFRDKRIVLHGSRNYAEAIIENFADSFNFIGIMSMDTIEGACFHGLKVITEEDFSAADIDLIILTERVKYAVEAFHSISRACAKYGIAIYNMYGVDEFRVHREATSAVPLSLTEAKELCSEYDIIAFEVMDVVIRFVPGLPDIWLCKYFYDLIEILRRQGKEVKFSLRKSLQDDIQIEALTKFGLVLDQKNEIIQREGEDLSFRKLREANPGKKILYFGIGLANEFILPRCYHIDTVRFTDGKESRCLVPLNKEIKRSISFNPGLKKSIESKIAEKEVVSFDIFDTLLIRKTLYPRDVFLLTEQKALSKGYDVEGFAFVRARVEDDQPFCDICQIYALLGEHFGWDDEMVCTMQAIELQTEREVLTPRSEVAALLRFAHEMGKRIVLTSDMYFPETVLRTLLLENGITGYEKIIVSCDVKKAKTSGLFNELLSLCGDPAKILHIGDNPVADGIACEAVGIDSILIPSALEMAKSRGWEKCIGIASDLLDRCLLGLLISKIFRNPFQNPNLADCPVENQLWCFGNSVIGPLAAGHLTWVIRKLRESHFAGILFLARDGWLPYNIYRTIREKMNLPKPIYYYANRHAAFLGCADFIHESTTLINTSYIWGIDAAEALKSVYMIDKEGILLREEGENDMDYIEKHRELIGKNAAESRKGYLRYSEKCGMLQGGTYAVYDFISVGHTQKDLSRFLPFELKGFYFWNYTSTLPSASSIEYYLKEKNALLLQSYIERLEPFFTSPEPSLCYMSVNGEPVFAEEHRSAQDLREVKSVLEAAGAFAKEFFDVFYLEGQMISPCLIAEIYAAEEFHLTQHTIYNDLLDIPIKIRAEAENKSNEVT